MQRLISVVFFAYSCVVITYAQILYECNLDTATLADHCFTNAILVVTNIGTPSAQPPTSPLSDVTSSLKPTSNGEFCELPYQVGSYKWDMYFCNNGSCPTKSNPNTRCTPGQFGHVNLLNTNTYSIGLETESGGINGTNEQCMTYFYYIPNKATIRMSIKIRKDEVDGSSEIIDTVFNNSFNGWIQRNINFNAKNPGYRIYFEFQKILSETPIFGFDEISIRQGRCSEEPVTQSTTTDILTTSTAITTTSVSQTSTVPSTISTTIEPTTAETTIITTVPATTTLVTDISISASTTTPFETTQTTTTTMETTVLTTSTATTNAISSASTEIPTSMPSTASTEIPTSMPSTASTATTNTTIAISTARTTSEPTTGTPTSTTTSSTPEPIGGNKEDNPSNKTLIIALATAIPLGLIAIIGIGVWIKRSLASGVLSGISHPFSDIAHQDESNVIELDEYDEDHTF